MRGLKRSPWLFGLGVLLAVLGVYGGHARADVTTDQSASIIIFPKVVVDGTRDTVIEIANTDNMPAFADCVYINTSGACSITTSQPCRVDADCPTIPVPELCVHQCTETNFSIFLTGQQPTFWQASVGRSNFDIFQGFSPGLIKPLATCVGGIFPNDPCSSDGDCEGGVCSAATNPFVGELKCIEVDASGIPNAQNSLKGEAIVNAGGIGGLSEYNAIGIQARVAPVGNTIVLDQVPGLCSGTPNACFVDADCGTGTCDPAPDAPFTYNACPLALYMNHSGEGAIDLFTGGQVNNELTLVPCSELLEQQTPVHAGAQFSITTELEQTTSCSVQFDCELNARLSDLMANNGCNFSAATLGGENFKTKIRPPDGKICYSGDARCHLCTDPDDIACINAGKSPGDPIPVGNCDCGSNSDCPNFVVATGSGACTLTTPHTCTTDASCNGTAGCPAGACTCPAGTCLLFPPPACTTTVDCGSGQTCTGAVSLGCRQWPGLLGVAEEFQTPGLLGATPGTAAVNLHTTGSRPGDVIVVAPAD